jgi:hypothetical protein
MDQQKLSLKKTCITSVILLLIISATRIVLGAARQIEEAAQARLSTEEMKDEQVAEQELQYRVCLGWVERISSKPFQRFSDDTNSGWTARCQIDDQLVADYEDYFAFMKAEHINYMVQRGLFGEAWPLDFTTGVPAQRAARIRRILKSAHKFGIRFLVGFGPNYQMGNILEKYPELGHVDAKGNRSRRGICPCKPQAQRFMQRTMKSMFDEFGVDGLALELSRTSSRCRCDYCSSMTDLQHLRMANIDLVRFVRENWPDKTLFVFVPEKTKPEEHLLTYLAELSKLNVVLDARWSPQFNAAYTSIQEVEFAMRNFFACHWITPPWSWDRLRWFMPQTIQETKGIKLARKMGASGYIWCSSPIANPGVEITSRFRARLCLNPGADPDECLKSVLKDMYEPKDIGSLNTLATVVRRAEEAYPWERLPLVMHTEIFDYLARLDEKQIRAYEATITEARDDLRKVMGDLGAKNNADRLLQCLENVLRDTRNPPSFPKEVQRRFGTIPAKGRRR